MADLMTRSDVKVTDYKYIEQTRYALILEDLMQNGIRPALLEGDIVKYYDIIVAGLYPLAVPLIDEDFEDHKRDLDDERNKKVNRIWAGKRVILSTHERNKINFEYASQLFEKITLLFKRTGLIGLKHIKQDLTTDGVPSVLIDRARDNMIKRNKNWIAAITGKTGSGKTYSAMQIASLIDPNFSIDNVVFSASECTKRINELEDQKGSVIVFDEAGVGIGARDWQSNINKQFNKILQIYRHLNQGLIFTTPSINFLDLGARTLLHAYIETIKIDENENKVRVKWKKVVISGDPKEPIKYRYPIIEKDDEFFKASDIGVSKPPVKLFHAYEKKKNEYSKRLRETVQADISPIIHSKNELKSDKEMIDEIIADPDRFRSHKGNITEPSIAAVLQIPFSRARKLKAIYETTLTQKQLST